MTSSNIASAPVNTATCPVCRTGHSGPSCPPLPPTVGERMFAQMTSDDFVRIGHEIGEQFGHSSAHAVAFFELAKRYRPESQR